MSESGSPLPDLGQVIPTCPLCGGKVEVVYRRPTTQVGVCVDCHLSITVPAGAWDVQRERRQRSTQ
jgi:hypothetical protein